MKILVVAGGTGGHFYPGLSVAKELVKKGAAVHFLVRRRDVVIPLVEKDGFAYSTILAGGFKRRLSLQNLFSIFNLLVGFLQSFFVLLRRRPDVVLAMGGYLSVPPVLAAQMLRIPVVLHEQNVKPGLANRVIGRWTRTVAVAFEESRPYFPGSVVTGNPIRPGFLVPIDQMEAIKRFSLDPAKKTLLVFGGSLGAHRLNDDVLKALMSMADLAKTWQVIHLSGPADEEKIKAAYAESPYKNYVAAYCHDMASAYAAADLVVCRAGASTISELSVLKKPALLIPYPFASENHQWYNALVLKEKGAAVAYEEKELAGGKMTEILHGLMVEEVSRTAMRQAAHKMQSPHAAAAKSCAELVYGVVKTPILPK